MFMTTDARVRSNWVTFEPSSASRRRQPTDKVPLHWNRTSPPYEYADLTKEYGPHHERITLPTTFNAK
jgi:hypothetical protein